MARRRSETAAESPETHARYSLRAAPALTRTQGERGALCRLSTKEAAENRLQPSCRMSKARIQASCRRARALAAGLAGARQRGGSCMRNQMAWHAMLAK